MYNTRKEFLLEVMKRADIGSLQEADRIARVVIGLIKARIPSVLSEQIAMAVPKGLAKGWMTIALPDEALEVQEMMFDIEETAEVHAPIYPQFAPEYG